MKISKEIKFIFSAFLIWRIGLFLILFLALKYLPLQRNFLGGGLTNYLSAPWFWAWANFDGEHYIAIAQHGYGFAEQAFFPLYPLLIKSIGGLFGGNLLILNFAGQIISNVSFLFALIGFYKLVKLDYPERVVKLAIAFLLLFPTSFYFASVYTESLFLALVIWSFYFARRGDWLSSSLLGSLASAIRLIGIILLLALFIEWYRGKARKAKDLLCFLLIPVGVLIYMYYLKQTTGDWLAFLHALPFFGEQRSATPILLPQVFYRYFFKILPNLNYSYKAVASFAYFPVVFTTFMEIAVGIGFLFLSILGFVRLRASYALYLALGYLIPTFSGSFSSLPRYVAVLFPAFILVSLWLSKTKRFIQTSVFVILFILLGIALSLFSRGYWIS